MENFVENLKASLHRGFIDKDHYEYNRFSPELVINNEHKNVLTFIHNELKICNSFIFSVAFITEGGLSMLKSLLLDLREKGIHGRILTSTFLNFNQPKVFKELLKITNVEVRVANVKGFHSKGYIFEHNDYYSLIVGSSNLTAHALKVNHEWNIKLTSHENGEIIDHFKKQFENVWNESQPLTYGWIDTYEQHFKPLNYSEVNKIIEIPSTYEHNSLEEAIKIKPNKMQISALNEIQNLRDIGKNKGLVISATGTGKTYLAAFDVRRFAPRKMLFIVHREQILNKAKKDFQRILAGVDKDFGVLSGTSKQLEAKYLFATIQTISKNETLENFGTDEFDYILIDEVHKAGASSYLKVIDYFKPKFLLGMTATPERTDDFNIFELFDYNIAYEIRLQEALEEDMLCPFHYFGVTDFEYNGKLIDDTTLLSHLVTEERVDHIIEKINYYGYSGESVKGLMFCSRKEEAIKLSEALNKKGFRTVALTGDHSQEERAHEVERLENGALDYILTVDIFNEGIDIPSINQVVMLRQTQSSIIFIQQLGRGLRKHKSKTFVTIIDFIGNYKNNYLIPIALSGDRTQNKDNIRRHTAETNYIKGISAINFEEIARKQIFRSINTSNLTSMKILREAFIELKNKIGRTPYLYDFIKNHSIDPEVIVLKHKNIYEFLLKMKEENPGLNAYENKVLTMLSLELVNGKRKNELILLQLLLTKNNVTEEHFINSLQTSDCNISRHTLQSVKRLFDLSFFKESDQKKYGSKPIIYINEKGYYQFNNEILQSLNNNEFFKKLLFDVLNAGLERSKKYSPGKPFTLYEKYTRKDACKLLNWDKDESSTIYGYKTKHNSCPIFITYHKNEDVDASVKYEDEFINEEILKWFTRSNRKTTSKEVQEIINAKDRNIAIHIFVKKDDDEGSDFYYLGQAFPDKNSVEQDTMTDNNNKKIPVVHMNLLLDNPVENNLYHYITSSVENE